MIHTPDDSAGFRDFDLAIVKVADALRQADAAEEHLATRSPYVAVPLVGGGLDQATSYAQRAQDLLGTKSRLVSVAWAAVERIQVAYHSAQESLREQHIRDSTTNAQAEISLQDRHTQNYLRRLAHAISALTPCVRCHHDHAAPNQAPLLELEINTAAMCDYGESGTVDVPGLKVDLLCRGCRSYLKAPKLTAIQSDHNALMHVLPGLLSRALRDIDPDSNTGATSDGV